MRKIGLVTGVVAAGVAASVFAGDGFDFGVWRNLQLRLWSKHLFGVDKPLKESSHESVDAATAEADPRTLATMARGLHVHVATSAANAGPNLDMIALWPTSTHPTHLIACNETDDPSQPGVQRIRLSDGAVETILSGTLDYDPVRRTPWGTILVGEENDTEGQVIEIIHPLQTTDVVFDHATGTAGGGGGASNVASRRALGRLSFEGIALYPNGVMYYGDENRPSSGKPGGAYFKFIPSTPWPGGTLNDLGQSPLASGSTYGLRLGKRNSDTDYGQGSNTGLGTWVPIPPGLDPTVGGSSTS
jgi:hypothetical protein